jgi:hypothetical protein
LLSLSKKDKYMSTDLGFQDGYMLTLIQFCGVYTKWMHAVLLTFQRYMLAPSSGLKSAEWVHLCVYIGLCFERTTEWNCDY